MECRLMGLETEFGLYGIDIDCRDYDYDDRVDDILSLVRGIDARHLALAECGESDSRRLIHWLSNGAKLYRDLKHPEYATPECLNVRDIVVYDKAGERILKKLSNLYNRQSEINIAFIKNNICYNKFSDTDQVLERQIAWGSHENYLLRASRETSDDYQIIPHLITRAIYTGAGHIDTSYDTPVFILSGRTEFIFRDFGDSATVNRPFIFVRENESHTNNSKWKRYQIFCGESNMLELPTYLKFFTTHLCLRLTEEGWEPPHYMVFNNNAEQFRLLSRDVYLKNPLVFMNGSSKTAIEIQRIYLEGAKQLYPLSGEERESIGLWEWVLDLLSCNLEIDGNLAKLVGVLDNYTKLYLIKKKMEQKNWPISHPRILGMNISYHSLSDSPEESLWSFLNVRDKEKPFIYRLVSEDEIEKAILNPPESRAKIRSDFIKFVSPSPQMFKIKEFKIKKFDWSRASVSIDKENFKIEFSHMNPFADSSESLMAFKARVLKDVSI